MLNARTRRAGWWPVFWLVALTWPAHTHGQDIESFVGSTVVIRHGAVPRTDDSSIATLNPRGIFRVERISGDSLKIASDAGKGWVKLSDIVLFDQAIDYCSQEIAFHPDAAWAFALRGLVYEESREPEIALADYNEALRLDPNDAELHFRRAEMRIAFKKDYRRALADYDEVIRLVPGDPRPLVRRADILRALNEPDRAQKDYETAIRLDPQSGSAYHGRALTWLANGESGRAIDDFNEAIRLRPNDAVALLNRGNAWAEKGENARALDDYSEAIRLAPNYLLAYNNRGLVWKGVKEYERAIADHNAAIRLDPRNASSFLFRGLVWKALGEYERSLADYDQAIQLNPGDADAYNGRAWIRATCPREPVRNGKSAYESAMRACELTHWTAAANLDTLAAAYAESRDFRHAIAWEQNAIERAQSDAERDHYRARLQHYQLKQPYRDVPSGESPSIQPGNATQPIHQASTEAQ